MLVVCWTGTSNGGVLGGAWDLNNVLFKNN